MFIVIEFNKYTCNNIKTDLNTGKYLQITIKCTVLYIEQTNWLHKSNYGVT